MAGTTLRGDVLELGGGAAAMAEAAARRFPDARLIVTDIDARMVAAARTRLASLPNARAEQADVTALPYPDASYDHVVSYLMLHHVIEWERALAEAYRVLRGGATLLGYDLIRTPANALIHRLDRSPHRLLDAPELRGQLDRIGFVDIRVRPGLAGQVMRFVARKP
jgi:ubiquinone/menaquinone biosynthesis C-methylase UbiE